MIDKEQSEYIKNISNTETSKCMKCGKCSGRCPAFKKMDIKPHQFVSLIEKGRVDLLLKSKSIWVCLSCMECAERCPRGVAPVNVIEAVRDTVTRLQNGNAITPEDVPPMLTDDMPQQLIAAAFRKYKK